MVLALILTFRELWEERKLTIVVATLLSIVIMTLASRLEDKTQQIEDLMEENQELKLERDEANGCVE